MRADRDAQHEDRHRETDGAVIQVEGEGEQRQPAGRHPDPRGQGEAHRQRGHHETGHGAAGPHHRVHQPRQVTVSGVVGEGGHTGRHPAEEQTLTEHGHGQDQQRGAGDPPLGAAFGDASGGGGGVQGEHGAEDPEQYRGPEHARGRGQGEGEDADQGRAQHEGGLVEDPFDGHGGRDRTLALHTAFGSSTDQHHPAGPRHRADLGHAQSTDHGQDDQEGERSVHRHGGHEQGDQRGVDESGHQDGEALTVTVGETGDDRPAHRLTERERTRDQAGRGHAAGRDGDEGEEPDQGHRDGQSGQEGGEEQRPTGDPVHPPQGLHW